MEMEEEITYTRLLICCSKIGLSAAEIEDWDIGMIFDVIIDYNNMCDTAKATTRKATQEDFDNF